MMSEIEPQRQYKRPPITEAVIEFQFVNALEMKAIEKAKDIFKDDFPGLNTITVTSFQPLENFPAPAVFHSHIGFRFDNADSTDIISLTTNAFAYSRLAPYTGWAKFSAAALGAYLELRKEIGFNALKRIGVRYINRLDVPLVPNLPIKIEHYLNIEPKFPDAIPMLQAFTMQTVHELPQIGCAATINVGSVASLLPEHTAFLLDIDIGRNNSVPQSHSDIRGQLDIMRIEKNRVFEVCVTDAARELLTNVSPTAY